MIALTSKLISIFVLLAPATLGAPQAGEVPAGAGVVAGDPNNAEVCIRDDEPPIAPRPWGWKEECVSLFRFIQWDEQPIEYSLHPTAGQRQLPYYVAPENTPNCKLKIDANLGETGGRLSDADLSLLTGSTLINCMEDPKAPWDTVTGMLKRIGTTNSMTLWLGLSTRSPFNGTGQDPAIFRTS